MFSSPKTWSGQHISIIQWKRSEKKVGLLRRQSRILLNKQKIDIYKTIIRPVFEYGSALFDNCSINDSLKLESCQRTAALICTGAMKRTESKLLMRALGWESLSDRRKTNYANWHYFSKLYVMLLLFICLDVCPLTSHKHTIWEEATHQSNQSSADLWHIKIIFPRLYFNLEKVAKFCNKWCEYSLFQKEINQHFKIDYRVENFTPFYHAHDEFFGKILTQIKLKLSPLNAQLFE